MLERFYVSLCVLMWNYILVHLLVNNYKVNVVFNSKLDLMVKKKIVTNYFWSIALYGVETRELRNVHQVYLGGFEIHSWKRVEKITWTDRVRKGEIQGESLARSPKLLSVKNYVIEIMTWKFIYTYWKRCKTGPAHSRCWNWSPFTSKHTWMRFSKF